MRPFNFPFLHVKLVDTTLETFVVEVDSLQDSTSLIRGSNNFNVIILLLLQPPTKRIHYPETICTICLHEGMRES